MIEEGSPAPSFRVKDHLGNDVQLDDFAGKNLVLWFYPKASTPG